MTSKVCTPLKLSANGMTVQVVGPIKKWDPDERSAVFSVEITQPHKGATVAASGRSTGTYYPKDKQWQAVAHVTGPTPLELGPALATATATITLTNGQTDKPYVWPVNVVLSDHLPQAAGSSEMAQPTNTTP